jgi:hypothetical protein
MTCPHCQTTATAYQVQNADNERSTVYECDGCHCRRVPIVDGNTGGVTWKWLPTAGYCAHCRAPIWRFATDPNSGQPVLLWPGPEVVSAQFTHASGGLSQATDFCAGCLPKRGTKSPCVLTAGGVPVTFGKCVKHVRARDRFAAWFTEARGAFLIAWARDHLLLDDAQHATFMAQWQKDRDAVHKKPARRGFDRVGM